MRSRFRWCASTCCLLALSLLLTGAVRGEEEGGGKKTSAKKAEEKKGDDVHHDETDLTHGFAGPNMEKPDEFRTDLAIYTFIVFVLLLLILKTFAWGPIMEGLERREGAIAGAIAQAEKNAAESEARLREYEAKLAEAAEEAKQVVAQARLDAEAAGERIQAQAEEARQRDRARFLADIETAKNAAVGEVAQQGAEIAVRLAGQIVQREIKPSDHEQLIKDSLGSFPSNN